MARIKKATAEERAIHRGVYPLHGFVTVSGLHCAVEFPNEGRGEPKYEVVAPEGYHFASDVLHSLLCTSIADLNGRLQHARLEACGAGRCTAETTNTRTTEQRDALLTEARILTTKTRLPARTRLTPAEAAERRIIEANITTNTTTTEVNMRNADNRRNPSHPRHAELMLQCCAQDSSHDESIRVSVEALDDTPMGVANGRTIFHVMSSDVAQYGLFNGCPLGRGHSEAAALADFADRVNSADRAFGLKVSQLRVTRRTDHRPAPKTSAPTTRVANAAMDAAHADALLTHVPSEDERAFYARQIPTVNVAIVFGDARTLTGQYAGWDHARSEVRRMATDEWYARAGFAAVFMYAEGQTLVQWTNIEMDELRRLTEAARLGARRCVFCGSSEPTTRVACDGADYMLCAKCQKTATKRSARCEQEARRGTGVGICDAPLDGGQCPKASAHVNGGAR